MDNQNTSSSSSNSCKTEDVLILVLMDNQNTMRTIIRLHLRWVLILVLMDNQNTYCETKKYISMES